MVHNWDLTQREVGGQQTSATCSSSSHLTCVCVSAQVSKKALKLLAEVEREPLLNLELLNPELVRHSESMAQAHRLRERLRLLGDYLLTCRSGACKKLQARCVYVCVCVFIFDVLLQLFSDVILLDRARLEQRTYLLESSHLYSVKDLRQVSSRCGLCYFCVHLPL